LSNSPDDAAQVLMAAVHGAMLSARAMGDPELFYKILAPQIAGLRQ
jgi:TetR/AcrR family transcriptional repressor of nem operon